MALGPVVSGSRLSEDEVVGPEDLAVGSGPDRVHGTGFEVNKNGPWDVLAAGGFVVVHVDTLQLRKEKSFLNIANDLNKVAHLSLKTAVSNTIKVSLKLRDYLNSLD